MFLITFIGVLSLNSKVLAQLLPDERPITLDFIDVPIDSALLLLSAESRIGISFDPNIIPPSNRVSLSANRLMLGLALDNVFVNTSLFYKHVGNQIVIKQKTPPVKSRNITVSGYLRDADTGEGLVYANVATTKAEYGSISNDYGYYSLTIPVGTHELHYSYVGYDQQSAYEDFLSDTIINVNLKAVSYLNEIVILGEVPKVSKQTEDFDQMPLKLLNSMASLAGEPDIIRMAQMRSGVSSQVDGFGGLQVRGGSMDQNLILLDGVPVYNTGHALGLFSIFNSSAIKSAKLIKGGFPARYGGRLSSVMDIRTKEGNNQKVSGDGSVSPLLVRGMIEGPIVKGKSSFLFSARRTIVDPWLKPLSKYQFERNDEEGQINFFFYDLNGKINFNIGDRHQVFLSGYVGKDGYENEVIGVLRSDNGSAEELDENNISWGNEIATLRWTTVYNKKMFGNASLSYTGFKFDNFSFNRTTLREAARVTSKGYTSRLFSSNIQDVIGSYDLDWYMSPKYYLKVGLNYTRHKLTPGRDFATTIFDNDLIAELIDENDRITENTIKANRSFESFNGNEIRAFIENEVRLGSKFSANIGGHFSSITVGNVNYTSLQPRLSIKYRLSDKAVLRAGYSEMDQYFHLLSSTGIGLPSDVWLPSTEVIPPEESRQVSMGITFKALEDVSIKLSGYLKSYDKVIGLAQGGALDISGNVDWEANVPVGEGESKGLEVELEKRTGKVKGWISYTLSESNRVFEALNQGIPFRANNDRRHLINIATLTQINANMELSISWTYGSSLPTTLPSSSDPINIGGRFIFIPTYPQLNNVDLPPYHKLDLGVNMFNDYEWGSGKLSFGAYNAYARKNPFYLDVVFEELPDKYEAEQISILPFIPYVSYSISF